VGLQEVRWDRRDTVRAGDYNFLYGKKGVYRVLARKPEGKRPLGRYRRRCRDNIMTDLQDVGCGGMDWIEMA